MCNFIDDIPTKSKTSETGDSLNTKFLEIFLKETLPEQFYRFRLIGISTKYRDNPFIEKYIHEMWTTDSDGKRVIADSIVCPRTRYVGKMECPICKHTDKLWVACKNSKWTDKFSQKKKRELTRKYCAHVLVYVINDPNYNANNGKLKVITFRDPQDFKNFYNKAKEVRREGVKIFNGGMAVDLWMRVGKVEEIWYEGTPRESKHYTTKITDMGFSTKPYTIPAITASLVDGFPFDQAYFNTSSESEVMAFYNKYCTGIGVDVPTDDIVPAAAKPKTQTTATQEIKENSVKADKVVAEAEEEAISDNDVDLSDLVEDVKEEADATPSTEPKDSFEDDFDLNDLDSLLDDIN